MKRAIIRRFSTLTKDRYPDLMRGNFSSVQDKDVRFFESILNKNQVITDADEVQSYNIDWLKANCGYSSIVLKPRTTEQVSAILKHCNERKLAVCPQGGNTGLVGGGVPVFDEIIISTSLMNKIINLNTLTGVLTCQSGCVLESLSNHLKDHGFIMPIDLGAKGSCQIGGNVSTNAGGLRLLRYGSLHSTVLGVQAVLANGDVVDCMNTLKKDNTGYHLKHLFIGSEGTLGLVTEVAVQCPPLPKAINLALLGLSSFEQVLNAFKLARGNLAEILSSCELMDQDSVKVVEKNLGLTCPLPNMPFYMLIETSGSNMSHDEEKLNAFLETCLEQKVILDGFATSEPSKMKVLWDIRENITGALLKDGFSYKYDVSLPLNVFYDIILEFRERLKDLNQVKTICGYGHLGDGNLHVNMTSSEYDEKIKKTIEPFIYEWISKHRGSISAEHGVGFLKSKYLHFSKTQKEIDIMKSLKSRMDPNGIMNPYKVLVLWDIRERGAEALKEDGNLYTFDVSLPLQNFYEGVGVLEELLKNNDHVIHVNGFGHLGDGNIHLNVSSKDFNAEFLNFVETSIFKWASKHRGSISAEHGIGFLKPGFLHYSKTAKEIELMKQFKNLLDPQGILNPYKVLPSA